MGRKKRKVCDTDSAAASASAAAGGGQYNIPPPPPPPPNANPSDASASEESFLVKKYKYSTGSHRYITEFVQYTKSHRMTDSFFTRYRWPGIVDDSTQAKSLVFFCSVGGQALGYGRGKTKSEAIENACKASFHILRSPNWQDIPLNNDSFTSGPPAPPVEENLSAPAGLAVPNIVPGLNGWVGEPPHPSMMILPSKGNIMLPPPSMLHSGPPLGGDADTPSPGAAAQDKATSSDSAPTTGIPPMGVPPPGVPPPGVPPPGAPPIGIPPPGMPLAAPGAVGGYPMYPQAPTNPSPINFSLPGTSNGNTLHNPPPPPPPPPSGVTAGATPSSSSKSVKVSISSGATSSKTSNMVYYDSQDLCMEEKRAALSRYKLI